MGEQKDSENLNLHLKRLEMKLRNLEHEIRNTYVYSCDSVWHCGRCFNTDGVIRSLEAEYEYGENSRIISRWMECEKCGWHDKQPGIIKKYVYESKFLK